MDPNNCVLYSNRANIYTQKGDLPSALADAEKCISLNPDFIKGYVRKADVLKAMGDIDGAMEAIAKGLEKDPNDQLL